MLGPQIGFRAWGLGFRVFRVDRWEFSKIRRTLFCGPYNEYPTIGFLTEDAWRIMGAGI